MRILACFGLLLALSQAFGTTASGAVRKVVVTGAAGKTGSLVFKKLLNQPSVQCVGVVRTAKSAAKLKKSLGEAGSSATIAVADVKAPGSLSEVLIGADSVVLCTSAVPKIKFLSLLPCFLNGLFKLLRMKPRRPSFKFGPGGAPEQVDYLGAKNQIDQAKAAGVRKFVMVSSMGGTQPDNFLNTLGKKKDGTGGDILLWKRKAEQHLIASGLDYTIVHPGGLQDQPGGKRELLMGVDDTYLSAKDERSIPREDVAEVCVQALTLKEAQNRSVDLVSRKEGVGVITTDFGKLFNSVRGNCNYDVVHPAISFHKSSEL